MKLTPTERLAFHIGGITYLFWTALIIASWLFIVSHY